MPPTITLLSTLTPPCNTRTWLSTPHPHLPIIATACSDKTARIYSLQNFEQQTTLSGEHKRSVRSCAWKPNSVGESVLATGSFDATAGIWKKWEEGGGKPQELDFTGGLAGGTGEDDDEDEDGWKLTVILEGHDSEIKSLAFSSIEPLLATCSRDKSVWIWEELEDENFETVAVLQDHEGDVKSVAWHPSEPLLASGSYDDTIRLSREDVDDWACCSLLKGHEGTVWWVEFEGADRIGTLTATSNLSDDQKALLEAREKAGPRLISCSDDHTIRVWHRIPKEKSLSSTQGRLPSIWKNTDFQEEWVEEARLPQVHERPVYAVSWSRKTGRVASTGSDGRIVVYEERWRSHASEQVDKNGDSVMINSGTGTTDVPAANGQSSEVGGIPTDLTEWVAVAEIDNAHDVFEINHICWALRADKGKKSADEEVLISTGDDGEVKVWRLET